MARLASFILLTSCAARLSPAVIDGHRAAPSPQPPERLESSEPERPAWVTGGTSDGAARFVGRGEGETLEVAKAAAERDLFASVSRFVSSDVSSLEEAREVYEQRGDTTTDHLEVHATVKSRGSAGLRRLKPSAAYWEKLRSAGLVAYRYAVLTEVPRLEVDLARACAGATVVVIMPFSGPEAGSLRRELALRLGALPGIDICPLPLVDQLVGAEGPRGVAELIDPALVVEGEVVSKGGAMTVRSRLRSGDRNLEVVNDGDWFAVQDAVVASISRAIGDVLAKGTVVGATP